MSNTFTFSPIYFISCIHIQLIFLLSIVFPMSIDFHVRVSIFYVSKQITFSRTNFFIHTRSQQYGNPYLFFYVSWRRYNGLAHLIVYLGYTQCNAFKKDLTFTFFLRFSPYHKNLTKFNVSSRLLNNTYLFNQIWNPLCITKLT